ncbi:MAG: non-homologous end-joining DNA ligase [Nitrospiraceae bacterium]|nr:non-homologous end-joining DNA ligase [Nitrospiraceae bacterium]
MSPPGTGSRVVSVGGRHIELTNLGKVLFRESGITKAELIGYYDRIAPVMLPLIKGRPITMHRFPGGAGEGGFFQKRAASYFPEWVNRARIGIREGIGTGERAATKFMEQITCENRATLVYLANLACIPHVWLSRVDKIDYPDRMVFDLDPASGPPEDPSGFESVRYGALMLREVLTGAGMESFVMTTGSRGLHVTVPLRRDADFSETRDFASAVAGVIAGLAPDYFTSEFARGERGGRLFIDTYRNAFAQTAVAPYAVRALPGAPVAAPVDWEEVKDRRRRLTARKYTIRNIFERLDRRGDPWKAMAGKSFSVKSAVTRLKAGNML